MVNELTFDILKTNNKICDRTYLSAAKKGKKRNSLRVWFSREMRTKQGRTDLQERREIHRHTDGLTVAGIVLGIEQNPLADTLRELLTEHI